MDAEKLIAKSTERAAILNSLKKSYGGSASGGYGGSGGGKHMSAPSASHHSTTSGSHTKYPDGMRKDRTRPNTSTNTNRDGNDLKVGSGGIGPGADARIEARSDYDTEKKPKRADAGSSRARDSKALDTLLAVIGSTDSRSRRYFSEQLDGKSLVLSNTGKRVRAASAASRGKAHLQRTRKRASETCLRQLSRGRLDPHAAAPRLADLQVAHALWLKFVWAVIDSCGSAGAAGSGGGGSGAEAQLQARLHTAGWLGAKVRVRFAASQQLRRRLSAATTTSAAAAAASDHMDGGVLEGYVCKETAHCLYVAVSTVSAVSTSGGRDSDTPPADGLESISERHPDKSAVVRSGDSDEDESGDESGSGSGGGSGSGDEEIELAGRGTSHGPGAAAKMSSPSEVRMKMLRVLRAYSEVVVPLPAKPGSGQADRVCVLRGQKYEEEEEEEEEA